MICTNCGIVINKGIDISHLWNNPEDTTYACSERCAEEAPKNWLSDNPTTLYKNKFKQKDNYKSPNFEKG